MEVVTWTKIEVSIKEIEAPGSNLDNLICRVFCKNKLKSLKTPFQDEIVFDLTEYQANCQLVASFQENYKELAYVAVNLSQQLPGGYGSTQQWFSMRSRTSEQSNPYRMKLAVTVRQVTQRPPTQQEIDRPDGIPGCKRCSYLQKLAASQQNEMRCLQQAKVSYQGIKTVIQEQYDSEHVQYAKPVEPRLEELGVEIPQLASTPSISKQEAEHLKEVIVGLNIKLEGIKEVQDQVKQVREDLFMSQKKRVQLQEKIRDTTSELQEKCNQQAAEHTKFIQERNENMKKLLELKQKFSDKTLQNDNLISNIATMEARVQELTAQEFNYNTMKSHIENLNQAIQTSKLKREELQQQYQKSLQDFQAAKALQAQNIDRLQQQTQDLQGLIQALKKQISQQKQVNQELMSDNKKLDDNIGNLQKEIEKLNKENSEIQDSRQIALGRQKRCIELQQEIHKAAKAFQQELKVLAEINKKLLQEKQSCTDKLNQTQHFLQSKIQNIEELTRENFNLMNTSTVLEQRLVVQQDKENIAKTLESQEFFNQSIKDILITELAQMSEYLENQSSECAQMSQTVLNCHRLLDEKEKEKNKLEEIVEQLRSTRPQYVPQRSDDLDFQISVYLKSREDWSQVSLVRKETGVYQLGKKEFQVFSENNTLFVRLGKGVMSFEEFLTTYIPIELNKTHVQTSSSLRQTLVNSFLSSKQQKE